MLLNHDFGKCICRGSNSSPPPSATGVSGGPCGAFVFRGLVPHLQVSSRVFATLLSCCWGSPWSWIGRAGTSTNPSSRCRLPHPRQYSYLYSHDSPWSDICNSWAHCSEFLACLGLCLLGSGRGRVGLRLGCRLCYRMSWPPKCAPHSSASCLSSPRSIVAISNCSAHNLLALEIC